MIPINFEAYFVASYFYVNLCFFSFGINSEARKKLRRGGPVTTKARFLKAMIKFLEKLASNFVMESVGTRADSRLLITSTLKKIGLLLCISGREEKSCFISFLPKELVQIIAIKVYQINFSEIGLFQIFILKAIFKANVIHSLFL